MRKHIMTAMTTILLLLLAACASAATPPADEIATQLQAALEMPMHGIMEATNQMPDGSEETSVMEMWQNGLEQTRTVTLEGAEGIAGSIDVRNGDEMWFYHPDDNTYSHMELSGMPSEEEMGGEMTQMVEQMLEGMEITYLGSGEVAERNTHELKLTPKEGAENAFILGETTISVDSETWYPLKMEIESEEFGTMKMEYREIEFNPDFPPDTFTFVPPEGAEEIEIEIPETREAQKLTLEEMREKAPFSFLEPTSLPEGLEFESALLLEIPENEEMSGASVTLNYRNGIEQLTINQFYSPEASDLPMSMEGGEKVTVRGQEAYSMAVGMGMRGLMWSEDELQIGVYGSLSEEEMLKVAESLE